MLIFSEEVHTLVSALNALSEHDAQLLVEGFGITTIENLANNKLFTETRRLISWLGGTNSS